MFQRAWLNGVVHASGGSTRLATTSPAGPSVASSPIARLRLQDRRRLGVHHEGESALRGRASCR